MNFTNFGSAYNFVIVNSKWCGPSETEELVSICYWFNKIICVILNLRNLKSLTEFRLTIVESKFLALRVQFLSPPPPQKL